MRKLTLTAVLGASMALGGCAVGEQVLGSVLGTDSDGRYRSQQERYAADTCARQAERYGRVTVTSVERRSERSYRVRGIVEARYDDRRSFKCDVRDDGRITDFDTDRIR